MYTVVSLDLDRYIVNYIDIISSEGGVSRSATIRSIIGLGPPRSRKGINEGYYGGSHIYEGGGPISGL